MSRSLYVGGLDEDVTEHVLRAAFIPFGNLKDAQLPLDKDGKSRGFAFIEFDEDEDAAAAIENMDGAELMGRAIRVNAAKPDKRGKQGRAIWVRVGVETPLLAPSLTLPLPGGRGRVVCRPQGSGGGGRGGRSSGRRRHCDCGGQGSRGWGGRWRRKMTGWSTHQPTQDGHLHAAHS